jgi:tetratricopeptide (TPR) repeat protein
MSSKPKTPAAPAGILTPEQAIDKYSDAIKNQASAANYLELGVAYYVAHRWQDAIQAFEQTIALDPKQAFAHYYLGILYASQGQRDKADAALAQVFEVSNNQMLKEQARARIPNIKSPADLGVK